jgi:hypothetical protein
VRFAIHLVLEHDRLKDSVIGGQVRFEHAFYERLFLDR